MTVYIVVGSWEYEGSEIIEVYSDSLAAEARRAQEVALGGYDNVEVQIWVAKSLKEEQKNPYFGRQCFRVG
jgi:hypothetical protein